ncbi:hypothetical protein O3G_MSEX006231 [Manduca sexta]|uniref:Phospholipase A2 n=1 Tax=Manduca sexta TaxID=7130 RepID=A0A921Z3S5_MANSE|nr:hypothetical protein O3G_MSEX006231 [Manduca sexta]UXP72023.1 esterase [Manduca sexta]
MYKFTDIFVFLALFGSCRCWVITRHEQPALDSGLSDEDVEDIHSEEVARQKFNLIFPGTKWCGTGDIADNYDDLGSARETDMCCREHDHCSDLILGKETKYNLTNPAFYTRLNCGCDEKFRLCLRAANTRIANRIGKIYFNALGTKCYREDYPVIGCNSYGGWFKRKCVEYSYNTTADRRFQWFDVNNY